MNTIQNPAWAVRPIRQRLLQLLVLAFGLTVLVTVVSLLALFAVVLSDANSPDEFELISLDGLLEGYYASQGNWEGAAGLLQSLPVGAFGAHANQALFLLDQTGQVLWSHGAGDGGTVALGELPAGASRLPLGFQGETVGTLVVVADRNWFEPIQRITILLGPVIILSIPLGLLTILIGFLLGQRFINPLADVIAAAQAVAGGNLSTRIEARGPGDLRALSDSFNHMADALERNDVERRNLLADIAHELRTPLSVIRGRLEGVVDGIYSATQAEIVPVLEETYTLERLVDDLRTLTLAEAGQLQLDLQPLDLGELAGNAVGLFEVDAVAKDIRLRLQVAPDLPAVSADPQRMGQVIGNLISNALRYTPPAGQVDIDVRPIGNTIEFAVRDTGPGVAPEDLPHIFDRFWRAEKARTRATGGTGLGLAIVKQLVESQQGTLQASNMPGGGFKVAFRMPVDRI